MSWQCPQCDAYNEDSLTECDICGAARPAGAVTRSDPPGAGADPAKFRPAPVKKPEPAKKVSPPKTDPYITLKKEAATTAEAARAEVTRALSEAAKAEEERKAREAAKKEAERKARELSREASERRAREHAMRYWKRTIRKVLLLLLFLLLATWIIGQVRQYRETKRYFEEAYRQEMEAREDSTGTPAEVGADDSEEKLSPFEQAVRDRREEKTGE